MKRLVKFVLPLLVAALGVGIFVYLKNSKPVQTAKVPSVKTWQVDAQPVKLQAVSPQVDLIGQVVTSELRRYTAPLAARVEEVAVKAGDRVRKGQLLLALNAKEMEIRLDIAQADVMDLQAQLELESLNQQALLKQITQEEAILQLKTTALDRAKTLESRQLSAQSNVDTAQEALMRQTLNLVNLRKTADQYPAKLKQLNARLAKAQDALEQAKINNARAKIYAPADGIVESVAVTTASLVNPGQALLGFYALEDLEISAPVDSGVQRSFFAGLPVKASSHQGMELLLQRLDSQAQKGILMGYFAPKTPQDQMRLGQAVGLSVLLPPVEDAMVLPYASLYGKDRIYVIREGLLKSIQVKVWGNAAQGVEALPQAVMTSDQWQAGDWIMTSHLTNAVEGLAVKYSTAAGE